MFKENKKEIIKKLLPVLRMTNNLQDLFKLEYIYDQNTKEEYVRGYFSNGHISTVNTNFKMQCTVQNGKSKINVITLNVVSSLAAAFSFITNLFL